MQIFDARATGDALPFAPLITEVALIDSSSPSG